MSSGLDPASVLTVLERAQDPGSGGPFLTDYQPSIEKLRYLRYKSGSK